MKQIFGLQISGKGEYNLKLPDISYQLISIKVQLRMQALIRNLLDCVQQSYEQVLDRLTKLCEQMRAQA